MAKITRAIVEKLNAELNSVGVGLEYHLFNENTHCPSIRLRVKDGEGIVWSSTINCTDAFYMCLNKWFKDNYDIELCYNSTEEICWSKDFTQ